jgi:hypothetical protein
VLLVVFVVGRHGENIRGEAGTQIPGTASLRNVTQIFLSSIVDLGQPVRRIVAGE